MLIQIGVRSHVTISWTVRPDSRVRIIVSCVLLVHRVVLFAKRMISVTGVVTAVAMMAMVAVTMRIVLLMISTVALRVIVFIFVIEHVLMVIIAVEGLNIDVLLREFVEKWVGLLGDHWLLVLLLLVLLNLLVLRLPVILSPEVVCIASLGLMGKVSVGITSVVVVLMVQLVLLPIRGLEAFVLRRVHSLMLLNVPVLVIPGLPRRMLGVLILVVRAGVMTKDMLIWVLVLTMVLWCLRLRSRLLVSLMMLLHMVV